MRLSLVLSTNAFLPLVPVARQAEEAGFHRLWTTESTPRDATIRAVTLALHTSRIRVATGIAYAFTRSPLAMAAAAADAHIAAGGRFALGLGAGTKGMRTRRYGITDFDHPAPRMSDYVGVLRAAWAASERLAYEGPYYRVSSPTPLRSPELDGLPPIEVFGSGVNRRMLADAAASCDGVALHPLVSYPAYLERVARPALTRPDGARPWIAAWRITAVDADAAAARWRARRNLAFYFTTPSYAPVVAGTRWEAAVTAVRETFRADPRTDFAALAELVPDAMVDDFCLAGTPDELPDRIAALDRELHVDELVLQVAGTGMAAEEYVAACGTVIAAAGR